MSRATRKSKKELKKQKEFKKEQAVNKPQPGNNYIVNGKRQGNAPVPTRNFGTPNYIEAINNYQPQQQDVLNAANESVYNRLGALNLPGNQLQGQGSFAPIEQDARRKFIQSTVPSLAERFASMGSGAALSSPDLNRQLSGAGADLESQIAGLRAQYGLEQQGLNQREMGMQNQNYFNLLQAGLTPQESFVAHDAQSRSGSPVGNFVRGFLPSALGAAGAAAGGYFGGPGGAQAGGQAGHAIGQGLGNVRGNVQGFNNQLFNQNIATAGGDWGQQLRQRMNQNIPSQYGAY